EERPEPRLEARGRPTFPNMAWRPPLWPDARLPFRPGSGTKAASVNAKVGGLWARCAGAPGVFIAGSGGDSMNAGILLVAAVRAAARPSMWALVAVSLLVLWPVAPVRAADCPRGALDVRFCDRDGDLVADAPTDSKE